MLPSAIQVCKIIYARKLSLQHVHQWKLFGAGASSEVYRCIHDECEFCPRDVLIRLSKNHCDLGNLKMLQERYYLYYSLSIRPLLLLHGVPQSALIPLQLKRLPARHSIRSGISSIVEPPEWVICMPNAFAEPLPHPRYVPIFDERTVIDRSFPPSWIFEPLQIEWKPKSLYKSLFEDTIESMESLSSSLFCRYCMQHAEETLTGTPFCPFEMLCDDVTANRESLARLFYRTMYASTQGSHKSSLQIRHGPVSIYSLMHLIPRVVDLIKLSGILKGLQKTQSCCVMSASLLCQLCVEEKGDHQVDAISTTMMCAGHTIARRTHIQWREALAKRLGRGKYRRKSQKVHLERAIESFYVSRSIQDSSITVHVHPARNSVYPDSTGCVFVIDFDDKRRKSLKHYAEKEQSIIRHFCDCHRSMVQCS